MSPKSLYVPHTMFFFTFWKGQVHKDSKLGIMTNVSKSRLVKGIFSNIHKSDACANSFGRYILIAHCMRNVFTFYWTQASLEIQCFWENQSSFSPAPPSIHQLFSPQLFNFIQNIFSPTPILKRGQRLCILYERYKGETIWQYYDRDNITILYDRFSI